MLNVKRERLREWVNQGFTKPTVAAQGAGTKAEFSIMDVYRIAVFKRLVEAGVNRRRAALWVNTNPRLNDVKEVEELTYILVVEEKHEGKWFSYLGQGPWNIANDLQESEAWDVGVVINFRNIRNDVKKSIVEH